MLSKDEEICNVQESTVYPKRERASLLQNAELDQTPNSGEKAKWLPTSHFPADGLHGFLMRQNRQTTAAGDASMQDGPLNARGGSCAAAGRPGCRGGLASSGSDRSGDEGGSALSCSSVELPGCAARVLVASTGDRNAEREEREEDGEECFRRGAASDARVEESMETVNAEKEEDADKTVRKRHVFDQSIGRRSTSQALPVHGYSASRVISSRRCLRYHEDPRLKRYRANLAEYDAREQKRGLACPAGQEREPSDVCRSEYTRRGGTSSGVPPSRLGARTFHGSPHSDGKLPDFSAIPFYPCAPAVDTFLSHRRPSFETFSPSTASFASLFVLHACPRLNRKACESAPPALDEGKLYLILDLDNTIVHAFGCSKINADIPLTDWVDELGRGHLFRFASGAFSGASAASGTPTPSATVNFPSNCMGPQVSQSAASYSPREQKEERDISSGLDRGTAGGTEGADGVLLCQPTERKQDSHKAFIKNQGRKGGDVSETHEPYRPLHPGAPFGLGKEEYYLKLRPFVREFLELLSEYFELAICTAGLEEYAEALLTVLDPDGKYFGARVVARRAGEPELKKSTGRIYPGIDPRYIVIVDDRLDVWREEDRPNIVKAEDYSWLEEEIPRLQKVYPPLFCNTNPSSSSPSRRTDLVALPYKTAFVPETQGETEDRILDFDNHLIFMSRVLLALHRLFFRDPRNADVRSLLTLMRRKVLEGCSVGFSCPSNEGGCPRSPEPVSGGGRSLPKNYRTLLVSPWTVRLDWGRQLATSFGAEVVYNIAGNKPPDFVVDLRGGRQTEDGKESSLSTACTVVDLRWLFSVEASWTRPPAFLFSVARSIFLTGREDAKQTQAGSTATGILKTLSGTVSGSSDVPRRADGLWTRDSSNAGRVRHELAKDAHPFWRLIAPCGPQESPERMGNWPVLPRKFMDQEDALPVRNITEEDQLCTLAILDRSHTRVTTPFEIQVFRHGTVLEQRRRKRAAHTQERRDSAATIDAP